jgi:hypothetical protein
MALVGIVVGLVALIVIFPGGAGVHRTRASAAQTMGRRLPPFWSVRAGDTYAEISAKTGLTVAELEAFNPGVDPLGLVPGERLNLWRYPPKPLPPPLGPRFWTVRSGESFGSIAAKTGINIVTLEQLNPRLKPNTLQPGDRVRLRH